MEEIKQLRQKYLMILASLSGAFILTVLISIFLLPLPVPFILLLGLGAGILVFQSLLLFFHRRYRQKTKDILMQDIAKMHDLTYDQKGCFKLDKAFEIKLLPKTYHVLEIEDGFSANDQASLPLAFQEVRIAVHDEKDDRPRHNYAATDLFKGLVIRIKLKKALEHQTVILSRIFPKPTAEAGEIKYTKGLKPVKLIDPVFSRSFEVLSTDQIESRQIFDPAFMERFKELDVHFQPRWLEASFYEDELLIALHIKQNMFEVGSLLFGTSEADVQRLRDEVMHIMALPKILKHNSYLTS